MLKLAAFNLFLLVLIVVGVYFCKKYIKTEKGKRIALLISALATILCHYSSLLYHALKDGTAMQFLQSNPNLILPIYPCNVVMWCCLILAFTKIGSKRFAFLADYIFLFGSISALVGMFFNVDFINDPTFLNYDVTKGIVAHGFMLFNIFLVPALGFYKLDLPKNMIHIFASILMMFGVGLYCNLVFYAIASEGTAYSVNSMFILHSPFDGLAFLTYPNIAGIALVLYFLLLALCERLFYKKGERWLDRLKQK